MMIWSAEKFELIYAVGEIVKGLVLSIENPNCRVRLQRPFHEFMDDWCQQGPTHHIAIGYRDLSEELEIFAESRGFRIAKV